MQRYMPVRLTSPGPLDLFFDQWMREDPASLRWCKSVLCAWRVMTVFLKLQAPAALKQVPTLGVSGPVSPCCSPSVAPKQAEIFCILCTIPSWKTPNWPNSRQVGCRSADPELTNLY